MRVLRGLFSTGMALWSATSLALAQSPADTAYQFRRLSPHDGLPAASVHAVLQDGRGFLWLGTYDGLVRYDGSEFRVSRHDPQDGFSLADNRVRSLCEDADGRLWIATEGGLDLWDRNLERFSHVQPDRALDVDLATAYARCLLTDRQGRMWVGTYGGGLLCLGPRQRRFERLPLASGATPGLEDSRVLALCEDHRGHLWVGTESGGLMELDPATGRGRGFMPDPANVESLISSNVRAICEDPDGVLWVGTDVGLAQLDAARTHFRKVPLDAEDASAAETPIIDALVVDREGRLWVGTDGSGLREYHRESHRFIAYRRVRNSPESLASDVIRTVYQDRQGDYWIGAYPDSVYYVNRLNAPFRTYRPIAGGTNTLSDETVNALLEADGGGLWVGTDKGGLNHLDPATGRWSAYQHDPLNPRSLGANGVQALCEDHQGRLWVGTWNGGLNRLDPATGTFRQYLPERGRTNALSNPHVWAIAEDAQQQLWIATSGGLNRYLPAVDGFVQYQPEPGNVRSLNHSNVKCLLVTRDGRLWVGTRAGLARRDPITDSWDRIRGGPEPGTGLSQITVVDLFEDRRGLIWIATQGDGIFRFDPATGATRNYRFADGLPSDVVRGILEDDHGRLWLATNNGLSRFDPQTGQFQTYGESHGLQGRQFQSLARVRLRSGDLLFGGTQGFSRISPGLLEASTHAPPVVLTRFDIFNATVKPGVAGSPLTRSITETSALSVSARASVLSLQFAALSYRAPELNQFAFKLEGFDRDWRKAGRERRATYTNLDPGRYRFRVKAANEEGVWNEDGAALDLIIVPRWWQTTWCRGGLALLLTGGLVTTGWGVANRRTGARLREAEREQRLAWERQRAAEALRASETRYRELFEHASDGISIVQDGKIMTLNARFAGMCGYPLEDVVGKALAGFIHPEDRPMVIQRHRQRLLGSEGLPSAYRFRVLRRDATPLWVELNTTAIQWEGQPATLNILRDVSERQRAEADRERLQAQLLQAQKMESVGRLAGGVAHDFNNMLQAILGNVDLALSDTPPAGNLRESLEEIQKAARRSADLTRQLLAFARKQTVSPKVLDLNETVGSMLKMLQRLIGEHLQLTWRPGPGLWPVKIDPSQIDQILANLTVNARDAIGQSGQVTIATANTLLDDASAPGHLDGAPGPYVMLAVSDTGCGISPETKAHLFEPFFTTKKVGEGTGLGLATVYGIVKQNGGHITVDSERGRGTTFRVYLPRAEAPVPAAALEEKARLPRGTETVLLVEDEEQILKLGVRMLQQQGYAVLAARLPAEAIPAVAQHPGPIHLLITDVVMPGMNGRELRDRVAATQPGLRCLFISGYTADVIAHQGVLEAGVEFLQKPFTLESLAWRVREVLDRPGQA
jgi:PAS domain S-box-containing protein